MNNEPEPIGTALAACGADADATGADGAGALALIDAELRAPGLLPGTSVGASVTSCDLSADAELAPGAAGAAGATGFAASGAAGAFATGAEREWKARNPKEARPAVPANTTALSTQGATCASFPGGF